MLIKRVFILFFLCSCMRVHAADINLSHLTVKDGLLNSTVYSAMQDSKGFIWFCTETGVCRYDGQKFDHFTMNDGLADNVIFKCYEDAAHRIWFLSYNGRLSFYLDGQIFNSDNTPYLSYQLTGAFLLQCIDDKFGNTWFCTSLDDVIKINKNTVTQYKTEYADRNHYDYYVTSVLFRDNDSVKKFVLDRATTDVYTRNLLSGQISRIGKFPAIYREHQPVGKSFCDENSTLIINGKDLISYNRNGEWKQFDLKKYNIWSYVMSFLADDHYLWLGTDEQGVYKIDLLTGNLSMNLLQGEIVTKIINDNEKNTWFVTHDNGVFVLKNNPQLFTTLNTGTTFSVSSMEYKSEKYVFCGDNNGTIYIARDGQIQKSFRFSERKFNRALDIVPMSGSELLIGSDAGLYGYNIANDAKTDYSRNTLGYKSYTFAPDSSLWFCTPEKILKFKGHKFTDVNNHLPLVKYTAIAVASDSVYYAGTTNKLYKVTDNGNRFAVILDDRVLKTQVAGLKLVNGNLWVATHGNGIFIVKDDKIAQHIDKTNSGIISDICEKLYDDGKKYIWLATNEGISVVGRDDFVLVSNINSDVGIASNDIKNISTDNERIYAATSEGTSIFKLSEVQFKSSPPLVYITGYKKGNGKVIYPHDGISFDYFKGFITISFAAITFRNAQNLQYEYKFADASEWHQTPVRDIPFFSLSPGTHSLLFRAKKYNSDWSAPVLLNIVVNPLWYQTTWFLVVLCSVLLLTIYAIIHLRLRAVRKKVNEEHEYNRKITDLESKALISQMNPHFIFNSLNTVQQLILVKEEQQSLDYLADFSILMRTMLENSRKQLISLADEIDFLNRYLQLESIRFSDKFAYNISVDEKLAPEEIKIPPALLQPLLENAIKYGISSVRANGFVNLYVYKENDFLVAVIEDNGIGIYSHKQSSPTGYVKKESTALKVLEERLKLIKNNKGEASSLKITDKGDGDSKTSGTIVELRISILN